MVNHVFFISYVQHVIKALNRLQTALQMFLLEQLLPA